MDPIRIEMRNECLKLNSIALMAFSKCLSLNVIFIVPIIQLAVRVSFVVIRGWVGGWSIELLWKQTEKNSAIRISIVCIFNFHSVCSDLFADWLKMDLSSVTSRRQWIWFWNISILCQIKNINTHVQFNIRIITNRFVEIKMGRTALHFPPVSKFTYIQCVRRTWWS